MVYGRLSGHYGSVAQLLSQSPVDADGLFQGLSVGSAARPAVEHLRRHALPALRHVEVVDARDGLDLTEHALRAHGEILVEQAAALRHVGAVNGIELPAGLPRVHVATVVAPACGLGIEGRADGVVQAVPQLHHALLSQQAVGGQHLLGAVQIAAGEAFVVQQVVEDAGGRCVAAVLARHVVVLAEEDALRVPAEEAEALALGTTAAHGVPVVVVPVVVAHILVDEHIVDELVHVEQRLGLRFGEPVGPEALQAEVCLVVSGIGCGHFGGRLHQLLPGLHVALGGFQVVAAVLFNLDDVDVGLAAAQVVLAVLVVHALAEVVDAPVHAVDEQVDIQGVHGRMSHLALHAACPHVAGVLCLLAVALVPVLPAVPEVATQHQLVELGGFVLAVEGVLQGLLAILLLEHQPQRVLGVLLGHAPMTAVQPQAAGDAESLAGQLGAVGPEQLGTGRARPSVSGGIALRRSGEDVYASAQRVVLVAEQVVAVGDDAQRGQTGQPRPYLPHQRRVARHLRIHLIVGGGGAPDGAVAAPLCGIALRAVALAQHVVGEEVGGCGHGRRGLSVGAEGHGPDDGVALDEQRLAVSGALGRGLAAVEGVANVGSPTLFAADGEQEL